MNFVFGKAKNNRANRCGQSCAFTVVELLTVVVILSIVAVLARPLFESTDATRLSAAARLVVADLQYAQMYSISHGDNPMGLKFDTSANSYTLVRRSGSPPFQCASVTTVTNPVGGQPFVTTFGSGRAAELAGVGIASLSLDGDECLVFGPLGELDQTAAATLNLTFRGATLTITVDPISGDTIVSP